MTRKLMIVLLGGLLVSCSRAVVVYADNTSTAVGEWQFFEDGTSGSKTDEDKFEFKIMYNTRYEVKVDHDSTDRFEVIVRDKDKRELAREEGTRSITTRFDTYNVQGDKVWIYVISLGAEGKYRIFTRTGWSTESFSTASNDLSDDYDVDYPGNPGLDGDATLRQDGNSLKLDGKQRRDARQTFTWDGKGSVSGDTVTFSFTTDKGDRGDADLTLRSDGSLSGTYTLNGKPQGDIVFRPRNRANRNRNTFSSGPSAKYKVEFTGERGLSGSATLVIDGTTAKVEGENRRNGRMVTKWRGSGSYDPDKKKIDLDVKVDGRRDGRLVLEEDKVGTFSGILTIEGRSRRIVMTREN